MNLSTKILFSILLVFKETFSTASHASFEHDITKRLDTCIANMLTKVGSDSIWNELHDLKMHTMSELEYEVDAQVEHFPHKVIFRDMSFVATNCMLPKFEWDFDENQLRVSIEKLFFNVNGVLRVRKDESYKVHVQLNFLNFTLNLTASQKDPNNGELSTSYDSLTVQHGYFQDDFFTPTEENTTTSDQTKELQLIITEAIPQIFVEFLNRNQIFDTIYKTYKDWKTDLVSTYPDFATDEKLFYYLIPRTPFFCFYFKRIVIRGLSNFQLVQAHFQPKIFTHTLLIRNVVGRMNLDYGTDEEKPMRLNFHMDYLTISFNKETSVVNVNARYYYINGTNGPLTFRQAPVVMHGIESAIASSIMSTMKVERTRDFDIVQNQIQVTKSPDWNTVKESYKEWIPFNEDKPSKKS